MQCQKSRYGVLIMGFVSACFFIATPVFADTTSMRDQLHSLESKNGGRIGVYAFNTENNAEITYHANDRFPMYCTAKMMGVSAILKKSMTNPHLLQEKIHYKKQDLIEWSPITKKHVADGMTVSELCKATITMSDNTSMNLLLKKLGGPAGLTAFAHSIGNKPFNLKSRWPDEAKWQWGDVQDTSTPYAMAQSLQKLALGRNVLGSPQRALLLTWLKSNKVGDARIRAGVPTGWIVADKTGTGFYDGGMGDIGIIWPPHCKPIVLAIYYVKNQKNAPKQQEIIAAATRIVLNAFAHSDQCSHQKLS